MRKYLLTASLLTALLVTACAQQPQTESDLSPAADTISVTAEPAQENALMAEVETVLSTEASPLPETYQGLSPKEISRAEIDELMILQGELSSGRKAHQDAMSEWRKEDPSRRGSRPIWERTEFSPEKFSRLKALQTKLKNAQIRKKYENLDPPVLTESEAQEIILLEQGQARLFSDYQDKIAAWSAEDPLTRGPDPELDMAAVWGGSPRLIELQNKVQGAGRMKMMREQLEESSTKYNISLSDSEMGELMELQKEQIQFENEFSKALIQAQQNSQLSGQDVSEEQIIEAFPKHLVQRMLDVDARMKAIKAPLEDAKRADRIQKTLTELSQESGIPILSGEISETIALTSEKEKIQTRTEREAIRKWLTEDGAIPNGEFLPNDEDYARLKEIEARLTAISAPMTDAKNAALETDNPALRQQRLEQEARKKWQTDWRDKKQSGEVPPGTPLTSPSYAELQDRVQDYDTKLRARAEKVGFTVPDADIDRLTALNAQMIDIRKTVFETEKDGSSHVEGRYGQRTPSFETAARMFKISLIENKQRQILSSLSETERLSTTPSLNVDSIVDDDIVVYGNYDGPIKPTSVDQFLESFQMSGTETAIDPSEIETLRAFERNLESQ